LTLAEAEPDRTLFTMPATDWFLSSQDQISAGAITMLADAAVACGVMIGLPPATPYTTAELSMTFLIPCAPGGDLKAIGRPLHNGRPLALAHVWVQDGRGINVAHGTSSCYILPPIDGVDPPDDLPPFTPPAYPTPDPYMRPAEGATIPWEIWRTMSGLELLGRQIAGDLPSPPIHFLTGMTLREATGGRVTFTLPAHEWLTSPIRTVQGGAIAMLAHAALATAVTSTLEAGAAYRPVDVKVNFLRPVLADGRELVAHGIVIHRGRTLAVATADVTGADGKLIATATGSTMILSERPAFDGG
jgi:uncharacterized protein (TIGR00369 family)